MRTVRFHEAMRYASITPGVAHLLGIEAILVDKCRRCGMINMEKYSVSEAARILKIDRRTLQRWVRRKAIPAPAAGFVNGRLVRFWTEDEMTLIKENKAAHYAGKGLDRRTGKKAKRSL